jgi:hypothetical protein
MENRPAVSGKLHMIMGNRAWVGVPGPEPDLGGVFERAGAGFRTRRAGQPGLETLPARTGYDGKQKIFTGL